MIRYVLLPVVGFIIGLLVISLGGGGGMFYVGVLTAFFNIPPAIAASTSLATIIPSTAIGAYSHWKAGNVNLKFGWIMLGGGCTGAILGSYLSTLLPQALYNKLTGVVMLLLVLQMIFSFLGKRKAIAATVKKEKNGMMNVLLAVVYGLLGGTLSGMVGISGGAPILAGLVALGCSALETVGTSVLVLMGIAIVGFLMHLGLGSVEWKLVGLLLLGTMSGAFVGPLLLKRVDKVKMEKILQPVLVVMVTVMGVLLLFK